jgi:hypothetical protein
MGMRVKRHHGRRKREALVHQHLENVSRDILARHPDVVRQFIGKNPGVYALYRKSKLYYVGLATALRGRLRTHVRTRPGKWDRFSIYLTIKDQHLREIEALLLRIANPPGVKQRGRLAGSTDLRGRISRAIRAKQHSEVSSLFGRTLKDESAQRANGVDSKLVRLLPQGARIRGTLRNKIFRARVRRDGKIRFKGKTYKSLSVAASAATKRPTNGWWFWQIERGRRNWVRLNKIRKAGTPVYA